MNQLKSLIINIVDWVLVLPFIIIGLCLLTIALSATVECVTGYSLIRETIRPAAQKAKP